MNSTANLAVPRDAPPHPGLSLVFAPGQRPSADDVLRLLQSSGGRAWEKLGGEGWLGENQATGFAISHKPEPSAGWLEILAWGLTFDLAGLAPAPPAPLPEMAHWYGFREKPRAEPLEAITLIPGEHLQGAENLLPVMRAMTAMATRLAAIDKVKAVVWHPARSAMAPDAFTTAIGNWLQGGPFPALGLTALFPDSDGAMRSEGLAFFIGRELLIEPSLGTTTAQKAQIAARLINQLVGSNTILKRFDFIGPNGEYFSVEPSDNDRFLRVWSKS